MLNVNKIQFLLAGVAREILLEELKVLITKYFEQYDLEDYNFYTVQFPFSATASQNNLTRETCILNAAKTI